MANGHVSDLHADSLVRAWLTRDISVLPTSYWVDLTQELPSDENGTGLISPTGCSRVELVLESDSWVSMGAGSRSMETAVDVLFDAADVDWNQILGYTLYDDPVSGLFLGYGLTNPYTILAGMRARLPAGLIVISLPF
jgi:hypothetical protein